MTTPRVSVVMPVYNTAGHLREAIESVRSQSYTDWELLIGDGGSTDGSLEIARSYAAASPKRVFVLEAPAQERSKPARNRNRALDHARGELVAFLDSDDLWEPSKLERVVGVMDDHPEVGLVYAYSQCIDEDGQPIEKGSRPGQTGLLGAGEPGVTNDCFERMVQRKAHAQTSSVVARTELVRAVGAFDEHIFPDGDTLLWTRLARAGPAYFLPEVLSYKRVRPGGIVRGVTPLQDAEFRVDYLIALARDKPDPMLAAAARELPGRFLGLRDTPARRRRIGLARSMAKLSRAFGPRTMFSVAAGLGRSFGRQKLHRSTRRLSRRRRRAAGSDGGRADR